MRLRFLASTAKKKGRASTSRTFRGSADFMSDTQRTAKKPELDKVYENSCAFFAIAKWVIVDVLVPWIQEQIADVVHVMSTRTCAATNNAADRQHASSSLRGRNRRGGSDDSAQTLLERIVEQVVDVPVPRFGKRSSRCNPKKDSIFASRSYVYLL